MAAETWAGMKARWQDALATDDDDTEFMARLPDLIGDAELRIYRDLDPLYCRKNNQALVLTPGSSTVTLPGDCWIPRRLQLLTGTIRATILPRDQSFLDEFWPDPAVLGTPKYWCMPADGTVLLAPTPSAGPSLLLDYTFRPATLSQSNPTTWLATNYPDLFYAAGMIWLAGWTKNYGATADDQGSVPFWKGEYGQLLAASRLEESRKKGAPPVEIGPSMPIPTASIQPAG